MAAGKLRAVVATASLDLGIDWGAVDQVIQVGAPKGVARLLQRVGRANHRMDEPSRAVLVPANRFEVIECAAALQAVAARGAGRRPAAPGRARRAGASTSWPWPAPAPSSPDDLFAEVTRAAPYAALAAPRLRRRAALRRGWRLRAAGLRPLPPLFRDAEGLVHVRGPAGRAAAAHEPRHHRGDAAGEGAAARRPGAGRGGGMVRLHPRRPATASSSPASCCASRGWMRWPASSRAAARASRACPPMPAAACR